MGQSHAYGWNKRVLMFSMLSKVLHFKCKQLKVKEKK